MGKDSWEQPQPALESMNRKDLQNLLIEYGIHSELWGKNGAKSMDDLLSEINLEEARLIPEYDETREEGGRLIRIVRALQGDIIYHNPINNFDYMLLPVENADRDADSSFEEPMRINESSAIFATKYLNRLGFTTSDKLALETRPEMEDLVRDPDYPGLMLGKFLNKFTIILSANGDLPNFYFAPKKSGGKTYRWTKVAHDRPNLGGGKNEPILVFPTPNKRDLN